MVDVIIFDDGRAADWYSSPILLQQQKRCMSYFTRLREFTLTCYNFNPTRISKADQRSRRSCVLFGLMNFFLVPNTSLPFLCSVAFLSSVYEQRDTLPKGCVLYRTVIFLPRYKNNLDTKRKNQMFSLPKMLDFCRASAK